MGGAFSREPPRDRPDSPPPSYGVPVHGGAFIEWDHVVERLRSATDYWLATVSADGRPHVVPIWGVVVDDELYLEIGAPETRKSRNLVSNDRVVVHLDDAHDAVILHGRAQATAPDGELGTALASAFRGKYPGYEPGPTDWAHGGLVRIEPATLLAWGDMPTATRWRFTVSPARS